MTQAVPLRLFLDSNVLTGGIVAPWGLDKAVLSLCAARICRMVLAESVREEVEVNSLRHAVALDPLAGDQVLEDYDRLVQQARPSMVPIPPLDEVKRSRHLTCHAADVSVLLSAIQSQPDWLLTYNIDHFTPAVARRTGLRIAKPYIFFQELSRSLRWSCAGHQHVMCTGISRPLQKP